MGSQDHYSSVDAENGSTIPSAVVGLQIVLRDQKSKEGFKYQSVGVY